MVADDLGISNKRTKFGNDRPLGRSANLNGRVTETGRLSATSTQLHSPTVASRPESARACASGAAARALRRSTRGSGSVPTDWISERNDITCLGACRFTHPFAHFKPMTPLTIWLERCPKGPVIDDALYCGHTPRGKLRTGLFWQDKEGPRASIPRFGRSQDSCFEADCRGGFGHLIPPM